MKLDEAFAKVVSEKEASLFRPSASQIGAAAKEYSYVDVVAFPSIDAALAASLLARVLRANGVDFSVRFELLAPSVLEEPTVLLGYPAAIAQEITVKKPSALIGYGERPQGILPLAVTASNDSSITALTVGVLSEIAIVGRLGIYAIIAGYWSGLDRGKRAEFTGVENLIIEMLKLENKVEEFFNIRLYRWPDIATEEAISITILPFFVGLSGRPEKSLEFLRSDPRLEPLIGKNLEEAPEQAVAVLGEKLYELLKSTSRVPRRPTEVIGNIYYSRSSLLPDLREASLIMALYAEKYLPRLLGIVVDEEGTLADAHYVYRKVFDEIVEYIEPLIAARLSAKRISRIQVVDLPGEPPSVLIIEKLLRQHGVVAAESVVAYNSRVPAESLVAMMGYGKFAELARNKCITYIERSIYVEVRDGAC